MLGKIRAWLEERRRKQAASKSKQAAIERALKKFHETRGIVAMGYALSHDPQRTVVRVMYLTDHIPPDRAWFAVPVGDGEIRELSFDEVAHLESPWR